MERDKNERSMKKLKIAISAIELQEKADGGVAHSQYGPALLE